MGDHILSIKIGNVPFYQKPNGEQMGAVANYFKKKESNATMTFKTLCEYIKRGYCFILASYKSVDGVTEENILSHSCIALDIDSKINPVTMHEMIKIVSNEIGVMPIIAYRTFSDVDNTRFRLIYRLEKEIDTESYRALYSAFVWKFEKQLDSSTKNANRMWCGTNKEVYYNDFDIPITFQHMVKLVNEHRSFLAKEERKKRKKRMINNQNYVNYQSFTIKTEKRDEVCDWIINNVSLSEFIELKFDTTFTTRYGNHYSCCPLPHHNGDRSNNKAFVVNKNDSMFRCFSHCGSGNIITVAKMVYGDVGFNNIVGYLSKDMNFEIKADWVG